MLYIALLLALTTTPGDSTTDGNYTIMKGYTTFRMNVSESIELARNEDLTNYSPAMISRYYPRPRFSPWWFVVNQWSGFSPQLGRTPVGYIVTWINTLRSPKYGTHDLLAQGYLNRFESAVWPPGIYCSTKLVRAHLRTCMSYTAGIMNAVYQVSTRVQYTSLRQRINLQIVVSNICPSYPQEDRVPQYHIWYHFGIDCDSTHHHITIAMATWRQDDRQGGIELAHFYNDGVDIANITEPMSETQTWPDVCFLTNGRVIVVWQNTNGFGIWGILLENNGAQIEGRPYFQVTEGMEPGYFWRPACVSMYGGQFFIIWKEDPYDAKTWSSKFPLPTIWMREFDIDGLPRADNPVPRRATVASWDNTGFLPVATTTLTGELWISWMSGRLFRGGKYDRFGNMLDYWIAPGDTQFGYPNVSRLGMLEFGDMDNGFVVAGIGNHDRKVICFRHDEILNTKDAMSMYDTSLEFLLYQEIGSYWDRWFLMNHSKYWSK